MRGRLKGWERGGVREVMINGKKKRGGVEGGR